MKVTKLDSTGKSSQVNVVDEIFGKASNDQLLSQAIRVYQANLRQGTSKVKSRGEVNRTKKKWYKQKGTGNARHAARSAPIFVGGGVTHGPTGVQNWSLRLSTKMRRQSLALALSAQAANLRIMESVLDLKGKTTEGRKTMDMLDASGKKILVILPSPLPEVDRSLRNIDEVLLIRADAVTALEVLTADLIVITGKTIEALESRLKSILKQPKSAVKKVVKKAVKKS